MGDNVNTGWDAETREKFAAVGKQEADAMELSCDRGAVSQLELRIVRRTAALYCRLSVLQRNRDRASNDISKKYEQYVIETAKIQDHIDNVNDKMKAAQAEIDQANLALRAIQTGEQES